jgi:hypothetical protein
MPTVFRSVVLIAGCFCAALSHADSCKGPTAPAGFPDSSTASEQDMLAAQQSVKKYLADMEDSLKCLNASHNESAYNHALDDMQKTAATFNTLLRAYRARQQKS